ncbi:MAG TPA: SRPBCC family protein [Streptosporangiaceae bacterium]|nr:SRPBCC family protein [Streptosporangiaceae bacterium]
MAMELDHSFTVPVPPAQAWDVLLDVQRIAPCMPGATVDTVDGDDVAGRLKVKVGPVSLTYKGTATFKDRDAASRSVLVEASGKEMRGAGTASATVKASLQPENGSDAATLVTLHTTLNVTGRPAQFGRGVIAEVGSRLIDKFADNLAQQLAGGAGAAGTSEPGAAAGADAAAGAAGPNRDGGTGAAAGAVDGADGASGTDGADAGAGTAAAESAPVETATVPAPSPNSDDTAASVSRPAPPPAPSPVPPAPVADQEDSLNLLSIAGPVIAKRVAPVAGGITGVVLITWLIRRARRRRAS